MKNGIKNYINKPFVILLSTVALTGCNKTGNSMGMMQSKEQKPLKKQEEKKSPASRTTEVEL